MPCGKKVSSEHDENAGSHRDLSQPLLLQLDAAESCGQVLSRSGIIESSLRRPTRITSVVGFYFLWIHV